MRFNSLPVSIRRQVANAPLPLNYEAARSALAECIRVDECYEWRNRAEAIASYYKQSSDKTLFEAAARIQLRAEERLGELLLQSKMSSSDFIKMGVAISIADRAKAIAKVPKNRRDDLIEGSPPISPNRLAAIGRFSRRPPDIKFSQRAGHDEELVSLIGEMIAICTRDPVTIAKHVLPEESESLRNRVIALQEWLDRFEQNLTK